MPGGNQPARELNLAKIEYFYGKESEDPQEWVEQFDRAAAANNWPAARQRDIAASYLRGVAAQWYKSWGPANNAITWTTNNNRGMKNYLITRFTSPTLRAQLMNQYRNLKQQIGQTVDKYAAEFVRLKNRLDAANN